MAIVQYKNFAYLKGPAGERGPKGDKGDRGPKGDQGPIGLTGASSEINYNEVRALLSGSAPITYNSITGAIGFDATGFATESYVNIAVANAIAGYNAFNQSLNTADDVSFNSVTTVGLTASGEITFNGVTLADISLDAGEY